MKPSALNNNCLYLRRLSSVFATLIESNLDPIVPVDSSAARIPLPGAAIAFAFAINSAAINKVSIKLN